MSISDDHELTDAELRMSARELVGDPMEGIPSELAPEIAPYLKMASTYGARFADNSVLQQPLPWPADHGERVVVGVIGSFDELIRKELAELTEPVFTAMTRQCFIAFSDRMDALMSGTRATEGAQAH